MEKGDTRNEDAHLYLSSSTERVRAWNLSPMAWVGIQAQPYCTHELSLWEPQFPQDLPYKFSEI